MKSFFTPRDITSLVGISYRQVQYWDETHFLSPSYRRRGKYRLYTFTDLFLAYFVQKLRSNGASIQKLRTILKTTKEFLPRSTFPVGDLCVLVEIQSQRVLVFASLPLMSRAAERSYVLVDARKLAEEVDRLWPEFSTPVSSAA